MSVSKKSPSKEMWFPNLKYQTDPLFLPDTSIILQSYAYSHPNPYHAPLAYKAPYLAAPSHFEYRYPLFHTPCFLIVTAVVFVEILQ